MFKNSILFLALLLTPRLEALVTLPVGCLDKKQACAIKTQEAVFKSPVVGPTGLVLFENSSLFRDSTGYVFFLNGVLRAKSEKNEQIRSVFVDVSYLGEVFLKSEADQILIRNMSGVVKLVLRDHTELNLPQGMEIWVAGLDRNKKSIYGVVRKIDLVDHIRLWSRYYEGTKQEFKDEVSEFKIRWKKAQEAEANLYRDVASEAQRSYEKSEAAKLARAKKEEQQKKIMRARYIERSFSR